MSACITITVIVVINDSCDDRLNDCYRLFGKWIHFQRYTTTYHNKKLIATMGSSGLRLDYLVFLPYYLKQRNNTIKYNTIH